eukprot:1992100-Amphidinium_carterae.1
MGQGRRANEKQKGQTSPLRGAKVHLVGYGPYGVALCFCKMSVVSTSPYACFFAFKIHSEKAFFPS